jgi:hypothetical protein
MSDRRTRAPRFQNPYVEEREAQRKVAHRLIDIGYKALAREFHPDRPHGDADTMARLNRLRDKLKHSI